VPVIRNYGNASFDSLAQQGTPGGNPAKISPGYSRASVTDCSSKKGTVIAVLLVSTSNQKLVSINAAEQDGIGTELLYVVILVILILVLHLIMTWTDARRNGNSLG
jgi:hypothetical protein